MTLNTLCTQAHENAVKHGFWDKPHPKEIINSKLMLIVSELGEACEALRHGDDALFAEELADTVIRIADLCGALHIDLESAITQKMEFNRTRPPKHNKLF